MSVAYVPQASFLNPQPFNPPDNLSDGSDGLNPSLKDCLIEKYLTQLGKNELVGEGSDLPGNPCLTLPWKNLLPPVDASHGVKE